MSDLLLPVSEHLLAPGGLSIDQLPSMLGELAGPGIDAADLYFQSQVSESWVLEDGIVKEGSFHLDQGVGVRAQSGEKTGFAYSNAITAQALSDAARAARSIARAGQEGRVQVFSTPTVTRLYGQDNPLDVISRAEKVELLQRVDAATRALDPRIVLVKFKLEVSRTQGELLEIARRSREESDADLIVANDLSGITERTEFYWVAEPQ